VVGVVKGGRDRRCRLDCEVDGHLIPKPHGNTVVLAASAHLYLSLAAHQSVLSLVQPLACNVFVNVLENEMKTTKYEEKDA